jgi:hypothetical protein
VTAARFRRHLVTVRVASGEALVLVKAPVAVVATGGPPPSNNSVREVLVWSVNCVSSNGKGG